MIDFVEWVLVESARFQLAIEALTAKLDSPSNTGSDQGPATEPPVAACPDWTVHDLIWHLAEVQYFWTCIVEGNLASPGGIEPLARPSDAELPALMAAQSANLVARLEERNPGEPCWSWHPLGRRVGWVRRRQAHEALIHRVDAEMALVATGEGSLSAIDEDLATDGVDEMLTMMLPSPIGGDGQPTEFKPDGDTVRIEVPGGIEVPGRTWLAELGLVNEPDLEGGADSTYQGLRLVDPVEGVEPTVSVSGPASELDLWLWRRADLSTASVTGDQAVLNRFAQLATLE